MPSLDILLDATPQQLERAAALNHRELFRLDAEAVDGEVREAEGVTWTFAGPRGDSMVAFPELPEGNAGPLLDEIVQFYLDRGQKSLVGCWSLSPAQPLDLGARLLARGFQPGWQPCWMALDLREIKADHPRPAGLKVEANYETSTRNVPNLPNSGSDQVRATLARQQPERVQRFLATLDGKVVGHSTVLLTTGAYGVAGIYDVGVVPEAENRGIGKAVTLAACLHARDREYRYALLNATGRRMYEQLGFRWIGDGFTWWLNTPRLAANPPTPDRIALAEAVGSGDLSALNELHRSGKAVDLDAPMTNEMTLLDLAVECGQPGSAEWLVAHGAPLTPSMPGPSGGKNGLRIC